MIELIRTKSSDKDFKLLTSLLDEELHGRYGELQDFYSNYNAIEDNNNVAIVYYDKVPAACGCFKKFDQETAEMKRMFVQKKFRGKGISKYLLNELEKWALENGFRKSILETGTKQHEAIGLYQKSGYRKIDNYGQYAGIETSICMMKELTK